MRRRLLRFALHKSTQNPHKRPNLRAHKRECLSVVASCSAETSTLPRTFMSVGNGLWRVKDSLTVPLYCRADLHLAQAASLESSTLSIKCSRQVLSSTSSDCFSGGFISFTFDIDELLPRRLGCLLFSVGTNTQTCVGACKCTYAEKK